MRLTQIRSLCDLGGELCKNAQKIAIGLSIQCCGVKTSIARDAVLSSISRNVASTRMRVLNVVDRVFVRTRSQQIQINIQVGIHGNSNQRITGSVHANGIDQVVKGNDGSSALGHADRHAILHQVHHLADENLHVDTGLVAKCFTHRHHSANVAVVICTQ